VDWETLGILGSLTVGLYGAVLATWTWLEARRPDIHVSAFWLRHDVEAGLPKPSGLIAAVFGNRTASPVTLIRVGVEGKERSGSWFSEHFGEATVAPGDGISVELPVRLEEFGKWKRIRPFFVDATGRVHTTPWIEVVIDKGGQVTTRQRVRRRAQQRDARIWERRL
jgi:hypothetical protein